MTSDEAQTSTTGATPPEKFVGWLFLVIVAGLVVGVFAFGRYFVAEHQRLSIREGVLVWIGDVIALFWATVYFIRHTLLGRPIIQTSPPLRRVGLLWVFALLSIVLGLGADLWITLSLEDSEREAFGGARRTQGTILRLTKIEFEKSTAYTLHCSYADANQVPHTKAFLLRDPAELPQLAPAVVQAVRAEQLPAPVMIAYNPERPEQSWLADLGWRDKTRMHGYSYCVLMFQAMASAVFLFLLYYAVKEAGHLPWWYELHAVCLLAVEAAFVLLFGSLGLLFGKPFFWG